MRFGIYVELPATAPTSTEPRGSMVNNAFTERWTVKCAGGLSGGTIHIAGLSATVIDVLVRLERLDGRTQVIRLTPSSPSFVVEAAPSRWRVAATYLRLGTDHILTGVDHLLFVLGLLLIVGNRWTLFKTITAFTVAHSITLAVATLGYACAPLPPLNAAIALSILFLGPEIVRVWRGQTSLTIRYPWVVAFAFGLLHGFGFASGLKATGLPQTDIAWALASVQRRCRDRAIVLRFPDSRAGVVVSPARNPLAALGAGAAGLRRRDARCVLDDSKNGDPAGIRPMTMTSR